jgi:hypothetical protein
MARPETEAGAAIRKLLDKHNGQITHGEAVESLAKQGHGDVSANTFNVTKYNWKKANGQISKRPKAAKTQKATVAKKQAATKKRVVVKRTPKPKYAHDIAESFATIKAAGGVKAATAKLAAMKLEVETLDAAIEAVTQELAAVA